MNKGLRHLWLPGCVAALLMTSGLANGAEFTMEVVDLNGSPPANPIEVTVVPGDSLNLEFFFGEWSPVQLSGYQFTLAESSFSSGGGDPLELTLHTCTRWCSESGDPCDTAADCPSGESCDTDCYAGSQESLCFDGLCGNGLRCDYPGGDCNDFTECLENPDGDHCDCYSAVFVDGTREDSVFSANLGPFLVGDCQSAGALQGGYSVVGASVMMAATDPGYAAYAGTILVTVPSGACGDYTIAFNPDPAITTAFDSFGAPIPVESSATIVIHGPTCAPEIVSSDPPNCAIDARQPHALNNSSDEFGWQSIEITFSSNVSGLGASDFDVSDGTLSPPVIVSPVGHPTPETVVLELDRKISTRKWTCFALVADPDEEVCIGRLPGDVDASVTANADDIPELIGHLNGTETLPIFSVDIDRDGEVGPADILRLMDLLNGANDFDPWLGKFIGTVVPMPCPSE